MANANRDENRIPTLLGVSSVDIATPTKIAVNPSTNAVLTEGTTIISNALITDPFDSITVTYPDTATEVYTYKNGATTVGVVTVVYSDAVTKLILSTVVKS
jgi:hypothetical protein